MVMYALAVVLLPIALANSIGNNNMNMGQQWSNSGWGNSGWGNSGWGNSGWGNSGWGNMQAQTGQQGQQMQQGNNQWWGMDSQEDYEAYLKWCEERRLAIQEQEQQQQLLHEIEERAEEKKREAEREAVLKNMKWQAQLATADMFDGAMDGYTEMKVKYMSKLTMDMLKFCRCSDSTAHLQRYLMHGDMTYEPDTTEAFNLDDLEGIDVNDMEAVAQRLAILDEAAGIKLYCTGVKTYIEQVKSWEEQYNFLGM